MSSVPPQRMSAPAWAALLTLYVVWGSTYLAIRVSVETIPPFTMGAIRFLVAGAILFLLTVRRGDRAADPLGRRQWGSAAVVGGALLFGGVGMVSVAEQTVASGIAALFIGTLPLWMAVLGRIFLGDRLSWPVVAGILVGFAGTALLVAPIGGGATLDPAGLAALVISPIAWASGSLWSRNAPLAKRPLVATGMEMLCGGAFLAAAALVTGELGRIDPGSISAASVAGVVYLIVAGALVGFTCYMWLLRNAPVTTVATYAYVNPVIAVLLGAFLLGEPLGPRTVLAGAIIVGSVAVIVVARGRDQPAPAPED